MTNRTATTRKQKSEENQMYGFLKGHNRRNPVRKHGHGYEREKLREKLNLF